jgi:hypothetical protein
MFYNLPAAGEFWILPFFSRGTKKGGQFGRPLKQNIIPN